MGLRQPYDDKVVVMRFFSGWLGGLLKHELFQAARTLQGRAERAARQLERRAVAWFTRFVLKHAVGAALIIASIISLGASAREGLLAMGVPAWAAHLILAVVSAGTAFVLFRGSAGRRSQRSTDDDEDDVEEDREEARPRPPKVVVRVVKVPVPAARKRRKSRAKPKLRRRKVVRVKRTRRGWQVESGLNRRKKQLFGNKRLAIKAGKSAARKASAELIIHESGWKSSRLRRAA